MGARAAEAPSAWRASPGSPTGTSAVEDGSPDGASSAVKGPDGAPPLLRSAVSHTGPAAKDRVDTGAAILPTVPDPPPSPGTASEFPLGAGEGSDGTGTAEGRAGDAGGATDGGEADAGGSAGDDGVTGSSDAGAGVTAGDDGVGRDVGDDADGALSALPAPLTRPSGPTKVTLPQCPQSSAVS